MKRHALIATARAGMAPGASTIDRTSKKTLASFTDDELQLEVRPGRSFVLVGGPSRPTLPFFPASFGSVSGRHPNSTISFLENPDPKFLVKMSRRRNLDDLVEVNQKLVEAFASLNLNEWFQRHGRYSEEVFCKGTLFEIVSLSSLAG